MAELANCSRCGKVFGKTFHDVCQACYREVEEAFRIVYRFLSKRENREATMNEIVKATAVEEALIIKFIKERRLRTSDFPKLAYPCERCGVNIVSGRLCADCSDELKKDLERHERLKEHERRKMTESESVYYTFNKFKK
ncbi:TIGR03826 family flagellar region protein [Lentibacillus salinarum]|uniref:TIGR03826 family flagellar region protein n=1 Tax=Lentibacillus salinarum TaxID=446820 RepID=A0ABW3ZTW8_9BACI